MDKHLYSSIKFKKELGQNFLKNPSTVELMVEVLHPEKTDVVLEIGPGGGAVTSKLAPKVGNVLAVEFDRDLIPVLQKTLNGVTNVEIINQDILEFLSPPKTEKPVTTFSKIIGSLPYQITSPLLHLLVKTPSWKRAVILIQKEVAEKITAKPPKANYLASFLGKFGKSELVKVVPKNYFFPEPKVDGAVVVLEKYARESAPSEVENWSRFLHQGFRFPKKMINKAFEKDDLLKSGIDPRRRPGTLLTEEWERLYNNLVDKYE